MSYKQLEILFSEVSSVIPAEGDQVSCRVSLSDALHVNNSTLGTARRVATRAKEMIFVYSIDIEEREEEHLGDARPLILASTIAAAASVVAALAVAPAAAVCAHGAVGDVRGYLYLLIAPWKLAGAACVASVDRRRVAG